MFKPSLLTNYVCSVARSLITAFCLLVFFQKHIWCVDVGRIDNSMIQAIGEHTEEAAKNYETLVKEKLIAAQKHVRSKHQSRCPIHQSCFGRQEDPINSSSMHKSNFEHSSGPLIFVSSSMPKTALKELGREAKQKSARLIIRGMINNSMKDTALLVKEINYPLDIDPKLFKKFNVNQVPTFVIPRNSKGIKEWYSIRGNVSLGFALEAGKGETTSDHQEFHP
jgi:type-F conjugative transfer system pilin assembly protein TrbC